MARTYRDENDEVRMIPRISWGAIIAGGLSAIAVSILLNLLGLGLGFTAIDPLSESQPLSGLGIGTIIWWVVANLVALFLGGMVAGRMAGFISNTDGGLHGFLSWCLYTAVSLFFITSLIGSIISGVTGTVSSIFGGGQKQQEIVVRVDNQQQNNQQQSQNQQDFFSNVRSQVMQLINQAEQYNILPSDASENVNQAINEGTAEMRQMWQELNLDQNIDQFLNDLSVQVENGELSITVEGNGDYFNEEEIKNYLAQNTDLSEQEIEQMINQWNQNIEQAINEVEKLYQEAKQQLEQFSDKLADTIATISLVSFFIFVVGAIAAWCGGMMAAKSNPDLIEGERHPRV
ncbi:MAG TPA: hypothetical protein VF181_00505 [Balneolaceae bacterium]